MTSVDPNISKDAFIDNDETEGEDTPDHLPAGNELALANTDKSIKLIASGNPMQPQETASRQTILIVHASVGSGHKTAALAIEQAFNLIDEAAITQENIEGAKGSEGANCPYNVEVLDILDFGRHRFNGDNTASMFTGATRPFYDLTWRYTLTGRLLWGGGTIWAHVMFPKFVDYVNKVRPSAIICTHITAANVAVSARMLTGQLFPIVCVPTDYEVEGLWPHRSTDLFCVADERMAETLRPRKVPPSRILVTGIPASPSFSIEYDKELERKRFNLPNDKQVVLFLAGASLPRPYIHFRNSIRELLPYFHSLEDMHMVIVCGKDAEYRQELNEKIKDLNLDNVDVLGYVDEMAALMGAADLIVCKSGGLTVTECLCAGTPMILLGRAYGQEKSNVTMLTSAGAAYHVTTWRELYDLLRLIEGHPQMTDGVLVNASLIRRPDAAMQIARATIRLINAECDVLSSIYKKHFLNFYFGDRPAHIR